MGDKRLGRLPKTRKWRQVVQLMDSGGDVGAIAASSLDAVRAGLTGASHDPAFINTLSGIFDFLDCAASHDLVGTMRQRGYDVPADATVFDIVQGLKSDLDSRIKPLSRRSDLGEVAQNAFTETLLRHATATSASLFETTPETVQSNLKKQTSGEGMKSLMHDFFSSFTSRYLSYYLSRELSDHVGWNKRLGSVEGQREFEKAFDLYVRQTVRIADEFTPGWFGKTRFKRALDADSVAKFAHVAIKKICREFDRGGGGGEQ
jgi:hypothetical protein